MVQLSNGIRDLELYEHLFRADHSPLERLLGEGGFGRVFSMKKIPGRPRYALKADPLGHTFPYDPSQQFSQPVGVRYEDGVVYADDQAIIDWFAPNDLLLQAMRTVQGIHTADILSRKHDPRAHTIARVADYHFVISDDGLYLFTILEEVGGALAIDEAENVFRTVYESTLGKEIQKLASGENKGGKNGGKRSAESIMGVADSPPLSQVAQEAAQTARVRHLAYVGLQTAEFLDFLDEQGVVFRDLKPDHLYYRRWNDGYGAVKVIDFGLARFTREEYKTVLQLAFRDDRRLQAVRRQYVAGTPGYMSPEQIERGNLTIASDYWALGIMFTEMLAGHFPHEMDNSRGTTENYDLLLDRTAREPHLVRERAIQLIADARELPPAMIGAIGDLLSPDPAERSMGRFKAVLRTMIDASDEQLASGRTGLSLPRYYRP